LKFAQANPWDHSNEADDEAIGKAMKPHELAHALGPARSEHEPGAVDPVFEKTVGGKFEGVASDGAVYRSALGPRASVI